MRRLVLAVLLILATAVPAWGQTPSLVARGSGLYRVYVDSVEVSSHNTERKAIEAAISDAAAHPKAHVYYDHDYRVDVVLLPGIVVPPSADTTHAGPAAPDTAPPPPADTATAGGAAAADTTPPPVAGADSADGVVYPSSEVAFILGPQLRSGSASNPWPWYDSVQVKLGLALGAAFPADGGVDTLAGTVSLSNPAGNIVLSGVGTHFTTELKPGSNVYLPLPSKGGLWQYRVKVVQSDTEATFNETYTPERVSGVRATSQRLGFNNGEYLNDNYYDLGLALYSAYYRTGNTDLLRGARRVTDSWWGSAGIQQGQMLDWDGGVSPRGSSLGGLILRALDGRPEMWPWITAYTRTMYDMYLGKRLGNPNLYFGVRDGGYMLLYTAWLARVHPDPAVRAEFRQKAQEAAVGYYARLQYPDGSWRWKGNGPDALTGFFEEPFMVGLLLDGLEAVHQLTGDPTVAQAILRSVDQLHAAGWDTTTDTKLGVQTRGFYYFVYGDTCDPAVNAAMAGCGNNLDGTAGKIKAIRERNSLVVHAFGYAYKLTHDPKYLAWGDDAFAATYGHGAGPLSDTYSGLADDGRNKEYNQNYRSSGKYLAWRLGW